MACAHLGVGDAHAAEIGGHHQFVVFVGMVFQKPALFPGTVAGNITYGPELDGHFLTPAEITELRERPRDEWRLRDHAQVLSFEHRLQFFQRRPNL